MRSYSYRYNVVAIRFGVGKLFVLCPHPRQPNYAVHDMHRPWHFILYVIYTIQLDNELCSLPTVFGVQSARFHYCGTSTDYNNYIL